MERAIKDFETTLERLRTKLIKARQQKGLSQKELGELMGKPQSSIGRFENGTVKDPSFSFLVLYCLHVEIKEIKL